MPVTKRFVIQQGETLSRRWRCRNKSTGDPVDLDTLGITSGALVILDEYGGTEVLRLDTDNGGVEINYEADADGAFWSGKIKMSAAASGDLEDWGDGVYAFEISDGIRFKTLAQGVATLNPTTIE